MKHLYCFIKMITNVPVCDLPDESGCRELWGGDRFCTVKNLGKNAGKADE